MRVGPEGAGSPTRAGSSPGRTCGKHRPAASVMDESTGRQTEAVIAGRSPGSRPSVRPREGLTTPPPHALFAEEPATGRTGEHSGPTGRCLIRRWPPRGSATTIKPTPEGRPWRTDGAG